MSKFEDKILKKIANKIKLDYEVRSKWEWEVYHKHLMDIKNNEPHYFTGFLKLITKNEQR